jgi:peptidoglycan-associated lipoprotein
MKNRIKYGLAAATGVMTLGIAGCSSYITHEEYDPVISELRANDQRMQGQIDGLTQRLDALSQKYDVLVTQVASMVRVDTGAHFAVGDATLSEEDKPFLADFARALSNRPYAMVTVEGFADPQGPSGFNRRLGQRRADAVVEFLASNGMSNGQLRAVSYGEDRNRQVRPGATGPDGLDNRRVSLVIDRAGSAGAPATN